MVAGKIYSGFLQRNFDTHFAFLESQIQSSPGGGQYLCGTELTGADILMVFPLEAAKGRGFITAEKYPGLVAYVDRLSEREAYKTAVAKIVEVEGSYKSSL